MQIGQLYGLLYAKHRLCSVELYEVINCAKAVDVTDIPSVNL
jgi:hypothetical protein